jgi:hypothetical protein
MSRLSTRHTVRLTPSNFLLANVVGLMLATSSVISAVELCGKAGCRIRQVRRAQEATVEVEHRLVHQRPRQAGPELVENPEP